MEEVLGGRAVTERFATYLANWRSVLDRRIAEAMETFARDEIERVRLAIMPRCGCGRFGSTGLDKGYEARGDL